MTPMNRADSAPVSDPDYRTSHIVAGADYDTHLQERPFDAYMAAWEARHIPTIVKSLFPQGLDRYLDFACGTGRITSQIAPLARRSVAIDVSPSMMEQARVKCPQTVFHCGDITRDDMELGQFDLVSSFRFFGNAQDELRQAALAAIVKRMVSGGYLLINSHRNPRALYALLARLSGGNAGGMDLTLPKLRRLLAQHGLAITRLQPIGAWLYRARLMHEAQADSAAAIRNERRFSRAAVAAVAPDTIVVARKE